MKKIIYILCSILLIIVGYKIFSYYDGYRLDVEDPCITREKIDEKSNEYEKYVFDEMGNRKPNDYVNLTKAMYEEIHQNGKYKIFILLESGKEKLYVNGAQELNNSIFLEILIDRYF